MDSAGVMKKVKFDMVFFGLFSPRPGTKAFEMNDSVSQKEKMRREKFLNEILKKTARENNKKYVDKIVEVLIETCHSRMTGENKNLNKETSHLVENSASRKFVYFGKTRTMKNVKINSKRKNLVGKIVKAKIVKANVWNLEGNF